MSAVGDDAFIDAVVVLCDAGTPLCQGGLPAAPERVAEVRATLAAARAQLEPVGLWPGAPVIMLDAPLRRSVAFSVQDAASVGLDAYAGRPATLFAVNAEPDLDVVVHELTHVWMRAAGWNPPRWELEGGRATHQSAVLHEGIADFVAAALTQDPTIGEGLGSSAASRSIDTAARCPDDLTGFPHLDAAVVSGALWELSGAGCAPADLDNVLSAIVASGPSPTDRVGTWARDMTSRLATDSPSLAMRWMRLVDERGLRRCGDAIALDGQDAPALGKDLVAAGNARFDTNEVTGPLRFRHAVEGESALRLTGSTSGPGLQLRWRLDDDNHLLSHGTTPLAGSPVWTVDLTVPPRAKQLDFSIASTRPEGTTFELLSIESTSAPPPAPPTHPTSGCTVGLTDLLPTLLIGVVTAQRRARTAQQRAMGPETRH